MSVGGERKRGERERRGEERERGERGKERRAGEREGERETPTPIRPLE